MVFTYTRRNKERSMKKKYKKVIYIFSTIILISIIGGVVKYSLEYIKNNPDKYQFVDT